MQYIYIYYYIFNKYYLYKQIRYYTTYCADKYTQSNEVYTYRKVRVMMTAIYIYIIYHVYWVKIRTASTYGVISFKGGNTLLFTNGIGKS